jgi:hypothetical protein
VFQNFTRNTLNIDNWNVSHKGILIKEKMFFYGELVMIKQILMTNSMNGNSRIQQDIHFLSIRCFAIEQSDQINASLDVNKISGYFQDNLIFGDTANSFTLQAGIRYNYNSLNNEFLLSPRVGASWQPKGGKDIIYRAAVGIYDQPPFYRELRRYDGTVNTDLKAQKSFQVVGGFDYNFKKTDRPMRMTVEAYYKKMWMLFLMIFDNVRIRYYGENSAKAYAYGIEGRLFGELVKDAESWISVGLMDTKENIEGDHYQEYTIDTLNQVIDSTTVEGGWFRRPTDRTLTLVCFSRIICPPIKTSEFIST